MHFDVVGPAWLRFALGIVRMRRTFISTVLAAVGCVGLTGCMSSSVEQLGNGYYEVTYIRSSFSEPEAHRITLQYSLGQSQRRTMVWPDTMGIHAKNGIAVFQAHKASETPDPNNRRATESRLFAVRAPDPPLDITDEVLWRWSKKSGEDFAKIVKTASISYVIKKGDGVEAHFDFFNPPDWQSLDVPMDWNQVSEVMREVKEKGIMRKDRVWHYSYIQNEFTPKVQK